MIVLFTDFGPRGPYVGQVSAVLHRLAPAVPVVELCSDAPSFEPRLAGYLLAAYSREFAAGDVFLCVVDPGVGDARRGALVLEADGRRYVGPDNGLLEIVARRAREVRLWEITWRPERLSASFHGRDLFAPVAARLAAGDSPEGMPIADPAARFGSDWPDDLARVVYVDHFGNCITAYRADRVATDAAVRVGERRLPCCRTFSEAQPGEAFWYENANGLLEFAVNLGRADESLGLRVGSGFKLE